jgi:pimeloyl-ACP methyl ester carboxylesterase
LSVTADLRDTCGMSRLAGAISMAVALAASACGGSGSPGEVDGPPGGSDAPPTADAPPGTPDARPDARIVVDDPCFPTPSASAGHHVLPCDGIDYEVEVPPTCAAAGCGIIVDVHGLTMSGNMQDANTGLRTRGADAGFVVIQPSANPDPPQSSWSDADDPKIHDFLLRAIAFYGIDPDRVHMTGFSQGGFMTWRFLCNHADTFASVAPAGAASACITAGQACSFTGSELPSRELAVLYMHGREEQNYIPWTCAQPQVDAIASAWNLTSSTVIDSDATFTRTRYSNAGGTVLEFLAHDYHSTAQIPFLDLTELQGHCFPGSTDPGGAPGQLFSFKCEQPTPPSFVWGEEVVEFFVAHPK